MLTRMLIVVALVALPVGCGMRRNEIQREVDLMRAEMLVMEDEYYALEEERDNLERQVEILERQLESEPNSSKGKGGDAGATGPIDPTQMLEPKAEQVGPELESPKNNPLPAPADPTTYVPKRDSEIRAAQVSSVKQTMPRDTHVTHLVVNPHLTRGHDFDGEFGDEGIQLVLEPRNANDEFVPLAGSVSIAVIDPEADPADQRVALYEMDPKQTEKMAVFLPGRPGISFKLQWNQVFPKHEKLRLHVRYTNKNDEIIEASGDLRVSIPGVGAHRWTKREKPLTGGATPTRTTMADNSDFENRTSRLSPNGNVGKPESTTPMASPTGSSIPGPSESTTPRSRPSRPAWSPHR